MEEQQQQQQQEQQVSPELQHIVDQVNEVLSQFNVIQANMVAKVDQCLRLSRDLDEKVSKYLNEDLFVNILQKNKVAIEQKIVDCQQESSQIASDITKHDNALHMLMRANQQLVTGAPAGGFTEVNKIISEWQSIKCQINKEDLLKRLAKSNAAVMRYTNMISLITAFTEALTLSSSPIPLD